MRCLFELNQQLFRGFSECDEPNFTFRSAPCNFYSGTKALAEEAVSKLGQSYIWRFQNPFNEVDKLPNLFSKRNAIQKCTIIWVRFRSLTIPCGPVLIVGAARSLWYLQCCEPGAVTTRQM